MSLRSTAAAATCLLVGCMRLGLVDTSDDMSPDGAPPVDAGHDGGTDADTDEVEDADISADGDHDDPTDGGCVTPPCVVLDPASNGCVEANEGPFVEVSRFETGTTTYGIWPVHPYLVVGATHGGIWSLLFDGTDFSERHHDPGTGWTEAIWNRGSHLFVGSPGSGLRVFELGASGSLSLLASDLVVAIEARRPWGDGSFVYVPCGADGLHAYEFDGATLSHVGAPAASLGFSLGVHVAEGVIYFADNTHLRAMSFDGAAFTETAAIAHEGVNRAWVHDGVVFVTGRVEIGAYRLEAGSLVPLASFPVASPGRGIWSDGVHVFVAAEAAGILALRYTSDGFVEVDRVVTDGPALGVAGDGTYIYAGASGAGVIAYGGFACRRLAE